jgi:PAS domain S-box-containing protein
MKRPWLGGSTPRVADEREQGEQVRLEAELRLSDELGAERESPPTELTHDALVHELRVHQIELEMQNEELRRTQSELIASRARFRDLYDTAPVGYLTLDEGGVILDANFTATDLLGVPRAGLTGWPMFRFILPEDKDTFYLMRRSVVAPGVPQVCDVRMVKSDGRTFWANVVAVRPTVGGDHATLRVALTDATVRIEAELALRERELQLRLALQGGDLGLWDSDTVTRRLVVNDRFLTMLGRPGADHRLLASTPSSR